ncbi:E3 ubiquitin-protein ligase nedd4 [Elasticomyces elasticus]|nr:E3 ubiquitin-protein ligase nedd4 [Elasticomyces elasticus]
MADLAALPPGWFVVATDDGTGVYYWYPASDFSQWEDPRLLPSGWEQRTDPATGRPYFIDHNTGTTRWEDPRLRDPVTGANPTPVAPAPAPVPTGPLPPGWSQRTLPNGGRTYFAYHPTRVTQWTDPRIMPTGWEQRTGPDGSTHYANPAAGQAQLADPRLAAPTALAGAPPSCYFICINCGHPRGDPAHQDGIVLDRCDYCRDATLDDNHNTEHKWCINGKHAGFRQDFIDENNNELPDQCRDHDQPARSHFFNTDDLRNMAFGYLTLDEALAARQVLDIGNQNGMALALRDYNMVQPQPLICEQEAVTFGTARPVDNDDWCPQPPWFEPVPSTRIACNNVAMWTNPVTGNREPSVCREDDANVAHIPRRHRLVCPPCKAQRFQDLTWRRRELWFPVCETCRGWANNNLPAHQTECECTPVGFCTQGRNGNEARAAHLCYEHDKEIWANIERRAQIEIERRRRLTRKATPSKSHYAKKKASTATRLDELTPVQRRGHMKYSDKGWGGKLYERPRCFCGNRMTRGDLDRPNGRKWNMVANPAVLAQYWRNCVGCKGFVNTTH